MKNLLLLSLILCGFNLFAQHGHSEIEDLFAGKTLADFEQNIGLTPNDYQNQILVDYIDFQYQDMYDSIHTELENGTSVSQLDVDNAYQAKILFVQQNMPGIQGSPQPIPNSSSKQPNGPCVNMDFETGDFTGWTLTRGNVTGATPYSYAGEFAVGPGPYHTVFGGGVDPVTGIPRVNPLNGNFSVRLGNGTGVGARAARLKQTFLVDATNYLFTYSYAVIFESPGGHSLNQLPYFTVRVIDSLGNNVNCGEYSVIADATTASDYQSIFYGGSTVLYKNWETVFTNLSAYIGQNVTIEFTSGDCSLTGHYGYAYVDATCNIDQITASNNIICAGDSSLLTAPAGAAAYDWSNGATTQTTTVYAGGTYSCTMTPFQGGACSLTLDITITENPSPTADFDLSTNVVCLNDPVVFTDQSTIPAPGTIVGYQWDFGDGTITPVGTGALGGVPNTIGTYLNPIHTYTTAGNYTVQLYVVSADGCADSITYDIIVNPLPIVDAGPYQTVCDGEQVTLVGSGAVTYAWDNGITDGVAFMPTVGTTTYTVTGTDANGCVNTDQVDVTVNPFPIVNAGTDQIVCDGEQVTLSGSGAVTYAWDNGITNGVAFTPTVGTTTYTVTGTDANGCINTDQVDVTVNPLPIVNAVPDQIVCEGTQVTLSAMGSQNISWNNGVANNVPFLQGIGTMVYTVTDVLSTGCSASDDVQIEVLPNPIVSAEDIVLCEGDPAVLNGSGAVSYSWSDGVQDGVAFYPTQSGQYTVTGTGANGCSNIAIANVTVWEAPIAAFTILDLSLTTSTPMTGFDNLSSGAVSYNWDFGDGSPNSNEFEPEHWFPDDQAGEYEITLTAYSAQGCPAEAIKYVHVFQDFTIYVPNAFTPDGNGKNEIFKPVMDGFDEDDYTLYIFNRWGDLIFESHNMEVGWDGKFARQDFQVQDGVYTWKIVAGLKDSSDSKMFVGHVSLLK